MMRSILCIAFKRRHLDRKSNTESAGVSSIKIGDSDNLPVILTSFSHSALSRAPLRSLSDDIPVSDEIIRCTNCTEDISRENTATGRPNVIAAFLARDNTKAVLPIPGRAATMTKSLRCHPEVILSRSVNPD